MEHHAYFWLKEEHKNAADIAVFEKALDELYKISEISGGTWGKSSATAARPVTDKTFDYGLSMHFESIEKHDLYQVHPEHDVFVDSFKSWWEKALIMDVG